MHTRELLFMNPAKKKKKGLPATLKSIKNDKAGGLKYQTPFSRITTIIHMKINEV